MRDWPSAAIAFRLSDGRELSIGAVVLTDHGPVARMSSALPPWTDPVRTRMAARAMVSRLMDSGASDCEALIRFAGRQANEIRLSHPVTVSATGSMKALAAAFDAAMAGKF